MFLLKNSAHQLLVRTMVVCVRGFRLVVFQDLDWLSFNPGISLIKGIVLGDKEAVKTLWAEIDLNLLAIPMKDGRTPCRVLFCPLKPTI